MALQARAPPPTVGVWPATPAAAPRPRPPPARRAAAGDGTTRVRRAASAGVACRAMPLATLADAAAAAAPALAAAASAASAAAPAAFEPRGDPAQLLVLASSFGAGIYWWAVVVPSERRALAADKRKGGVGAYLKELEASPERGAERWFYTDWLQQSRRRAGMAAAAAAKRAAAAAAGGGGGGEGAAAASASAAEAAPSSSAPSSSAPGAEEPVPGAAQPAFLSLDNPLVFVAAVLGAIVAIQIALHG